MFEISYTDRLISEEVLTRAQNKDPAGTGLDSPGTEGLQLEKQQEVVDKKGEVVRQLELFNEHNTSRPPAAGERLFTEQNQGHPCSPAENFEREKRKNKTSMAVKMCKTSVTKNVDLFSD